MTVLDSAQQSEISARGYRRADFVRIQFPAGELAYTTHDHDISTGGVTYAAGVLQGISGIRVAPDRKAGRIALHLLAGESSIRSAIEGDIHFAPMTFSIAVLDEDGVIITGLIPIGRALASSPRLTISDKGAILELNCETEQARFMRPRRVIAQDADQQWRFSGDRGLELVPRVPRSQAEWGGQIQSPGGGGGRGGGAGQHFNVNLH
jgi:hypothetical protein